MSATVTIRWLAVECRFCGTVDPFGVKVLHAKGYYCRECAPIIVPLAQIYVDRQFSEMMARGVFTLPTKDFDPWPPTAPLSPVEPRPDPDAA